MTAAPTPAPTPSPTHEWGPTHNDLLLDGASWSDDASWTHTTSPSCNQAFITVVDHDIVFDKADESESQAGGGTVLILDSELTVVNAAFVVVDC